MNANRTGNPHRRVVVTGIGAVTPLGLNETQLWENLAAGRCGIGPIRALDTSAYKVRNGAEVDSSQLQPLLDAHRIRSGDRNVDMALLAAAQALDSAGMPRNGAEEPEPLPAAVLVGTGIGANHSLLDSNRGFQARGVRGVRPTTVPRCMANTLSSQISIRYRLTGPNYAVVSACTSSTTAIGTAFRMLRDGYADVALCGGADAVFDPFVFAAWNNMGVMSAEPDPARACRPFDADRSGCILGEGAAMLVLETETRARARGARPRGAILGFGESSDATHITRPSPEGQALAITGALRDAGLQPEAVGFVNAHGTATRANDECEARSLRLALGDAAERIPVASNKSLFGHLLGASGAAETIATLLGLEARQLPPNLNLDTPDPACNLRFAGPRTESLDADIAMKNSFGFGGNNGVLILSRAPDI